MSGVNFVTVCHIVTMSRSPYRESLLTAVGFLVTLIDFTLSNARRFYSSMWNPLAVKGLKDGIQLPFITIISVAACKLFKATKQQQQLIFAFYIKIENTDYS